MNYMHKLFSVLLFILKTYGKENGVLLSPFIVNGLHSKFVPYFVP